jgi:hypothetical protein
MNALRAVYAYLYPSDADVPRSATEQIKQQIHCLSKHAVLIFEFLYAVHQTLCSRFRSTATLHRNKQSRKERNSFNSHYKHVQGGQMAIFVPNYRTRPDTSTPPPPLWLFSVSAASNLNFFCYYSSRFHYSKTTFTVVATRRVYDRGTAVGNARTVHYPHDTWVNME